MGSKWPEFRLDEITTLIIDCPHSTPEWTDSGVIVLRSNNIRNGSLDLTNPSFTTEEGYLDRIKRAIPTADDIVLTREAPMGEVCIIPKGLKCCLGQRMVLIRADKTQVIPEYLLYAIQSSYIQNQISWNEGTGTTVSNIRIPNIKALKIPLPSLNIQRGIVSNLLSVDKKISLNIATNQTLEQMSQTLFKSWFVDFDPVIDNALDAGNPVPEALQSRAELRQKVRNSADFKPLPADIRALFPAEFEETELGWVPKGWRIESFSEIAQLVKENVKSEDISTDVHYVGLEHLERKHIFITNYGNGSDVSSNKSAFNKGDLLFGKLRPYFHKVAITPFSGICSTDILVFRAKEKYYKSLMAMYAFTDEFVAYANLRSTGTRMPRAEAKDLLKYKIILPNKNILEKFELLLEGYWTKGQLNNNENEQLTALRDTLLPKLISGELSLEDLPDLVTQTEPA